MLSDAQRRTCRTTGTTAYQGRSYSPAIMSSWGDLDGCGGHARQRSGSWSAWARTTCGLRVGSEERWAILEGIASAHAGAAVGSDAADGRRRPTREEPLVACSNTGHPRGGGTDVTTLKRIAMRVRGEGRIVCLAYSNNYSW